MTRRILSGFCALVLIVYLAAFPARVRAAAVAAGALTAVGTAIVITAFLNRAGIYPFNPATGEGVSFTEWKESALQALINQFNAVHASTPITEQNIRGYAVGGVIAVANASWARLREFAQWIKDTYAPADNAQDVRLGVNSPDGLLPSYSGGGVSDWAWLSENGFYSGTYRGDCYFAATAPGVFIGRLPQTRSSSGSYLNNVVFLALRSSSSSAPSFYYGWSNSYPNMTGIAYPISNTKSYNGVSMWYRPWNFSYPQSDSASAFENIPFYQTLDDFLAFVAAGGVPDFNGVTADTKEVVVPPASDSDLIGLQVAGLGQGATVEALEDAIETGVQDREKPVVRQVEVETAEGVTVDTETGEVVESPVVVTPPLVISDYAIPSLSSVFPFSIPWDIARVWQALDAEPRFPLQDFSLTLPASPLWQEPPVISFSLAAFPPEVQQGVDDVAQVVRAFSLLIACIGFLVFISQFIKF